LIGGAALKIKENVGGWMDATESAFLRLLPAARAAHDAGCHGGDRIALLSLVRRAAYALRSAA
jgi:hypothetical protein